MAAMKARFHARTDMRRAQLIRIPQHNGTPAYIHVATVRSD
jgi:hypothetical protein